MADNPIDRTRSITWGVSLDFELKLDIGLENETILISQPDRAHGIEVYDGDLTWDVTIPADLVRHILRDQDAQAASDQNALLEAVLKVLKEYTSRTVINDAIEIGRDIEWWPSPLQNQNRFNHPKFGRWLLKNRTPDRVLLSADGSSIWKALQVTTPVFRHYPTVSPNTTELESFCCLPTCLKVSTNQNCFMDIHIGLDGYAIDTRLLRKILTLGFLTEHALLRVSAPHLRFWADNNDLRPLSLAHDSLLSQRSDNYVAELNHKNRARYMKTSANFLPAGFGSYHPKDNRLRQNIVAVWSLGRNELLREVYGDKMHEKRFTIHPCSPGFERDDRVPITAIAFHTQQCSFGNDAASSYLALCFAFFSFCYSSSDSLFKTRVYRIITAKSTGNYGTSEFLNDLDQGYNIGF